MDRLDDIRLFLRVLDLGSISAAARSLDLSVAVASQRLKRLEQNLRVRLLHRTTRRLHPTPEGLELAGQGRALVEDLEALTSGLREGASGVCGRLRVTMPSSFGNQYISPLLPDFMAMYPAVKLSVNLNDELLDLVGSGFDLGIRVGTLRDSGLVSRWLANNQRVACASPDYLRRHGTPSTPADLAAHECLLLVGSDGRQNIWRFTDGKGHEIAQRVQGRFESTQGELLRDAVVAGLGVSLHSLWHVHEQVRSGALQVLLPDFPTPMTGIHAVMPQRRLVPPRVRAFVDFVAGRLGEHPPWERGAPLP
jgi:DNA-binding transcriptional LysR family regulator